MQPFHPVSNVATIPGMVIASQVQALPTVCQPQVSQVAIQQSLVLTSQSQPQVSASLSGATQDQTSTVTPHLGQSSSIGHQKMVQQPELVQTQQPPFQQSCQGPEQQVFVSNGQPYYNGYAHQPCQSCQHYAGMQRPTAQAIPSYPGYASPNLNQQLPFVATLELPDLNRLTNDPIAYAPWWPAIPHKLPSDIPKFNGNPGEDPSNHVMTFHLWCSSNTLNDDSIRLRLI